MLRTLLFLGTICILGSTLFSGCGGDFRYHKCDDNEDCGQDSQQRPLTCACDGVCRASCDGKQKCLAQEKCLQGLCIHKDEPNVKLGQPCSQDGQQGVCSKGVYICSKQGVICQTTQLIQDEKCDGLDNDCDGQVDELLTENCTNGCGIGRRSCKNGTWEECDAIGSRTCRSTEEICRDGIEYCKDGNWTGNCEGEVIKGPEICDNKDNDCDGQVDEALQQNCNNACGKGTQTCVGGTWSDCDARGVRPCGQNKGECRQGLEECNNNKWSEVCVGGTLPKPEICDDRDNDCDGQIDEDWPKKGTACQAGVGECLKLSIFRCRPDFMDVSCPVTAGQPKAEICDGKDNDCNGLVDDKLSRPCSSICGKGEEICASGRWLSCNAVNSRVCGLGSGFCRPGAELCEKAAWTGQCIGSVKGKVEVCDGTDNDCDGSIDEDWKVDELCKTSGKGQCIKEGKMVCLANGTNVECSVKTPGTPKVEVCDQNDNDCDGIIDNVKTIVLSGHSKTVHSVDISPSGFYLASGSADGTVRIVGWNTKQLLRSFRHGTSVHSVAFSPDSKTIATGSSDKTIKLWEVATGKLLRTFTGHTGTVNRVRFDPLGLVIGSASDDNTARIWELTTGKSLALLKSHTKRITDIGFGLYSKIFTTVGEDIQGKSWNLVKGNHYDFWKRNDIPTSLAFGPFGVLLAVGGTGGAIQTFLAADVDVLSFRFAEMKPSLPFTGHTGAVQSVRIGRFGKYLISGSADRTVRIWSVAARKSSKILQGHTGTVRSAVLHPDNNGAASGSEDGTVRIWPCLRLP